MGPKEDPTLGVGKSPGPDPGNKMEIPGKPRGRGLPQIPGCPKNRGPPKARLPARKGAPGGPPGKESKMGVKDGAQPPKPLGVPPGAPRV